jgi:beta-carotene 3-hydroxylase
MTALLVAIAAFVVTEPAVALVHRRLMHRGRGWRWHTSHHRAQWRPNRVAERGVRGFDANDRFPLLFAALTIAVMAIGVSIDAWKALTWIGCGVTFYGGAYLLVHDGYIHGRAGTLPGSGLRYLGWVRRAHARHHATGGPPYGFLLPVTRSTSGARTRPTHGRTRSPHKGLARAVVRRERTTRWL